MKVGTKDILSHFARRPVLVKTRRVGLQFWAVVAWGVRVYLLPFRMETVWLAIDATHVAQILGQREWIPVPSSPALWPGVLAWHGRAVAVFDLGQVLKLPALLPGQSRRRTLICSALGNWLAIIVDEIREAQVVAETLCRPCQISRQRYASQEYESEDLILPILDPVAIVREALSTDSPPGATK